MYDVAVSDEREIAETGRATTPVGSTVDQETLTYTNEIGDLVLAAAWTDPDFDSTLNAFYYTRVMKIPTPSGRPMIASSSR